MIRKIMAAAVGGTVLASATFAQNADITGSASFIFNGQRMTITRADVDTAVTAKFSNPTADCFESCLTPMRVAQGVATVGEIEVIDFLTSQVESGAGLLVDARLPSARQLGFIPASVNVPAATLDDTNPYSADILRALGAVETGGTWNFAGVSDLMIFDAGPSNNDAQELITHLLDRGLPASKITYYRGGMQVWAGLGLSFVQPQS